MSKEIKVTCEVEERLPMVDLTPLQGDLKELSAEKREKLKKSIRKHGFSFPFYVWEDVKNNQILIIDGHQRLNAVKSLKEDGYKIPQLPVIFIEAKDLKEAKSKLLAATSQYGSFTDSGFAGFVGKDFDFEELSTFELSGLNMTDFFSKNILEPDDDLSVEVDEKILVSAHERKQNADPTDHVKMVQIFIPGSKHEDFLKKISYLMAQMELDNITDVICEVINEKFDSFKEV